MMNDPILEGRKQRHAKHTGKYILLHDVIYINFL